MFFDNKYNWKKLEEIKGKSFEEVLKWFNKLGLDQVDCGDGIEIKDADSKNCLLFIDGYWADYSPVIKIKNGYVACWYRAGSWD